MEVIFKVCWLMDIYMMDQIVVQVLWFGCMVGIIVDDLVGVQCCVVVGLGKVKDVVWKLG